MKKYNAMICELTLSNIKALKEQGLSGNIDTSSTVEMCAVDIFMKNISSLFKTEHGYIGISQGTPFVFTNTIGIWGNKNTLKRQTNHEVILLDTPQGGQSRIALESILAFIEEASINNKTRDTYFGLRGNCLGNEAVNGKAISKIEIVTNDQNLDHGRLWKKIYKDSGLVTEFSATDSSFKEYIRASQFKIDKKYLLNYPGAKEVDNGWVNIVITPSSDNGC